MHGRAKVSGKEFEVKKKERGEKMRIFQERLLKATSLRENRCYDIEAVELTRILLQANPDFYNMWNFRKEIIEKMIEEKSEDELDSFYKKELVFVEHCLKKNPKSYGSWHHRCWILNRQSNPDWKTELKLCEKCLQLDDRNFHCWDYRRFVAENAQIEPEDELLFTTNKIKRNFSNYSAWHYRSKLLPLFYPSEEDECRISEKALQNELEMVQHACYTDPNDQSAWFYHRWLLGRAEVPLFISHVYICKNSGRIIVSFSKETMVNKDHIKKCELSVIADNDVLFDDWTNAERTNYPSTVWILTRNSSLFSQKKIFQVTMNMNNSSFTTGPLEFKNIDEAWYINNLKNIFSFNYTAVSKDFLETQRSWCQELLEVEPDSKWTLLTLVLLLRVIDALKYVSDIEMYFHKLINLDPDRSNFYRDLRCRFMLEGAILEVHDKKLREFIFCKNNLKVLYHMQYLCHMVYVDLSHNAISSLAACCALQCVETLILDDNVILSCEGLQTLLKLQLLSVKNNNIHDMQALKPLMSCTLLHKLHLSGNAVVETENYNTNIKNTLPNLDYLDNILISQVIDISHKK